MDDIATQQLPSWKRVLDEASAAGFGGPDPGAHGSMPLDLDLAGEAPAGRGPPTVAGTIYDDPVPPANRTALPGQTDEICAHL